MTKRIGIVGAGNISETHARAAQSIPGVEIVAVCGANGEKTAALAGRTGAAAYDDFARFLEHVPMDLVAIGSPSGLHATQAIAAARRGLHVLVEKPIDFDLDRVDALIEASERAGVRVGVFFQDRLRPGVLKMKEMVDTGQLGTPVLASGRVKWYRPAEYYAASQWRGTWALDGGGALMNQGIHTADLLLWLFGPVRRVFARMATRVHPIEVEDTVAATLEFESGALGILEASTAVFPGYPRRVELTGSEGTVVLENETIIAVDLRSVRPDLRAASAPRAAQDRNSPVVADATAHRRIIADFIEAIDSGRAPACDAREGRRSVQLVQAIYRSAREARDVTLP